MSWKGSVVSFTGKLFPGLNSKKTIIIYEDNEISCNLPLQMSLFFNVYLVPIWIVAKIVFLSHRYNTYDELNKLIIVTIATAICIIEILRLYLGYEGNLKDKIPELAGFWMLSVLLQLPLQGFLLFNPNFRQNIIEILLQSLMFALLCIEVIFGYCALKNTASKQSAKFKNVRLKSGICLFDSEHDMCNIRIKEITP